MTQRQVVFALLALQLIGTILLVIGQAIRNINDIIVPLGIATTLIIIGVLWAYWRGWEQAGIVDIIIVTIAVGIGTPDMLVRPYQGLIVLAPMALAQILGGPRWILISMFGVLAILTVRAGPEAGYMTAYTGDLRTIAIFAFIVLSMALSRIIADTAIRSANANAQRAEEARARADSQAKTLEEQTQVLQEQNRRQQQLLDLVTQLETPAIVLAEGVLLAPVVGPIDDRRAEAFVGRLLEVASAQRAQLVVIDIAGASNVDERAASLLGRAVQALRLIGCRVAISGISADLARTLVASGVSFDGIPTVRTPREALEAYRSVE
ncbi:STAS domain-containing protein [Roseiflexus castenholzii]|uniref:Anti-sigma-factor antagonist n=1 Tax=Roseiflexus castenholzii (strain DSM 13941 / HLO8) TaxID=383372 RepID=A7NKR8_ROSCS|nr:STAS domain-containing protein [Roseiflexus castenholzii]ABU58088.1 anti-sigma-factor antagonist [Roseiflexus castenholzii DSM 13941]